MLILHCTQKMAAHLPAISSIAQTDSDSVTHWHAHVLTIQRRKCVLFVHDQTRFILLDRALTKPAFQVLHQRFLTLLEDALRNMGVPKKNIAELLNKHQPMHWDTKTQRSVLGSLNITNQDMGGILDEEDLMSLNIQTLHRLMNKRPMTIDKKYIYPDVAFLAILESLQN